MSTGKNKKSKNGQQKHDAIIFDKDAKDSFENFYFLAELTDMKYILYVQEALGEQNSVWACQEWQFKDCIETICAKGYFVNVQRRGYDMFLATMNLLSNTPMAS